MPANTKTEVQFRCTIQYMFKGCPKPDGWFGCFAKMRGGEEIRLTGKTVLQLTKGMQLDVTAIQTGDDQYNATDIVIVTRTLSGTKAYLVSLPGVSEPVAKRLVQTFGSDVIDLIRTDPDPIKNRLALTSRQINALVNGVTNTDDLNQIRTFLPELYTDAINYIKKNIPSPKQTIQNDPWILLQCPHTSFQTVDTIAIRLGRSPFDDDRIEKGILYMLNSMQTGDNYINLSDDDAFLSFMVKVENLLKIRFGRGMAEFGNRLLTMANASDPKIHIRGYKNEFHLYSIEDWQDYSLVKDYVNDVKSQSYIQTSDQAKRLKSELDYMKRMLSIKLTDEQQYAIIIALSKKFSVITGGPGRGKTLTVSCIAECNEGMPGIMNPKLRGIRGRVLLLAPTGRAAKKLQDSTNSKYETMTIDRLICSAEAEIRSLSKSKNPTPDKSSCPFLSNNKPDTLIIVDESSMVEMSKIAELFRHFNMVRYCFVGDKDQLPRVGKGQFFHDIIKCGKVAVAQLTIPMRNNGLILQNADKINAGDTALQYDVHEMPLFPQAADDQNALDFIIDQYNDERDLEPDESQIALICPVKKGGVGVIAINLALQAITCPENACSVAAYNPNHKKNFFATRGFPIPDTYYGDGQNYTRFRIGDTVMCTKSNYGIELTEYNNNDFWGNKVKSHSYGIFNGDIGKIIGYIAAHTVGNDSDSDFIVVQFNDGRVAELDRSAEEFDHFMLGYAMTVHKVQCCEYNTVIYVSPKSLSNMTHTGFACRNLAYTAITRARKRVVIVGSKESLIDCIKTEMAHRNSTLAEDLS